MRSITRSILLLPILMYPMHKCALASKKGSSWASIPGSVPNRGIRARFVRVNGQLGTDGEKVICPTDEAICGIP